MKELSIKKYTQSIEKLNSWSNSCSASPMKMKCCKMLIVNVILQRSMTFLLTYFALEDNHIIISLSTGQ
ncbi:hypothetical protein X975_08669, partial [Stegodyphus mimosarum]